MKKLLTRAAVSALLVGSLGLATVAAVPAGASTTSKMYSGKVKTADTKKDTFTLTVGTKTYTVVYTDMTKWTKGSAADLKAGASVSLVGKISGMKITASSISD